MTKLKLSSNNRVRKIYAVNFENDIQTDRGIYAYNDKVIISPNFAHISQGNFTAGGNVPERIFYVNGKSFIFLSNGKVCLEENYLIKWTSVNTYASQPIITEVYHNGQLATLITGENSQGNTVAEIYNKGVVTLPSKIYSLTALIDNVFWTSDGENLYFTHLDARKSVEQNLMLNSQLFIDLNYGQILDLISLENRLYIVCKHALLKVIVGAFPTDYRAQRIDTEILNIEEKSVVGAGNNIMFISNGNFCLFNGSNVVIKPFAKIGEKLNIIDYAGHKDGHYFLPVLQSKGTNRLYCYDVSLGKRYTLLYYSALSKNSGKAYETASGKLAVFITDLSQHPATYACSFTTKPLDFNTQKSKNLLGLQGKITGEEVLKIKGDFGEYSIKVKDVFDIKCNVVSQEFIITLSSNNAKMPLEDLKLIYRIQGE